MTNEAQQQPRVRSTINELQQEITRLEKCFDELESRLAAVVRPPEPDDGIKKGEGAQTLGVPLVGELRALTDRVRMLSSQAADLMARLEV